MFESIYLYCDELTPKSVYFVKLSSDHLLTSPLFVIYGDFSMSIYNIDKILNNIEPRVSPWGYLLEKAPPIDLSH